MLSSASGGGGVLSRKKEKTIRLYGPDPWSDFAFAFAQVHARLSQLRLSRSSRSILFYLTLAI